MRLARKPDKLLSTLIGRAESNWRIRKPPLISRPAKSARNGRRRLHGRDLKVLKSAIRTLAFATLAGALFFAVFLYVIVRAGCWLLVCDDKWCDPGAIVSSMASPDARRVVRIYNSFCGPPGAASNSYRVVLLGTDQHANDEVTIFRQEDDEPIVRWIGTNRLSISPGGWNGLISRSEHEASGVSIQYAVDLKAISDASTSEQKRISDHFESDRAEGINSNSTKAFARFKSWAERNASASLEH